MPAVEESFWPVGSAPASGMSCVKLLGDCERAAVDNAAAPAAAVRNDLRLKVFITTSVEHSSVGHTSR